MAETQRISGEITVQFPFQLLDVNGVEVDRYGTMKDAVRGTEGLADGWTIVLQRHLFAVIPGYWGIGEEQMCGVCGLMKSRHDGFVTQEILQDSVSFPKVELPTDPWRKLYPIAVCPHCAAYVHDEAVHRRKCT